MLDVGLGLVMEFTLDEALKMILKIKKYLQEKIARLESD